MKKFIINCFLFFIALLLLDLLVGKSCEFLQKHAKGGSTAYNYHIAKESNEDILIFGSSKAQHNYIPTIIEDSLGVSCLNCGEGGHGIILAYGRFMMNINRYTPKLVVYDIIPSYDLLKYEENIKYLGILKPYYGEKGIDSLFKISTDKSEVIKLQSSMYRHNSKIFHYLNHNISYRDYQKGYQPLHGKMSVVPQTEKKLDYPIDSLKIALFEKVITTCQEKKIPIIFTISPTYKTKPFIVENYQPIIDLCLKYNIPLHNYNYISDISEHKQYFQDLTHMNHNGAVLYSQYITKTIRNYLQ